MIDSGEMRKGITIELDDKLYQVLDYQHIKMGRGSAQVRLKLRDIRSGHIIERSVQASEKFSRARLDERNMQYLYNDGDTYYFMDEESFEQTPIGSSQLGDTLNYLKEGMSLTVSSYKGKLVGVEMPITVELEVAETGPGYKGDTATAGNKPAKLETHVHQYRRYYQG
jgi:elongation factor P